MVAYRLSVVIPTRNAGRELDRVLSLLLCQDVDSAPEILVIDSGSEDDTEEICRRHSVRFEQIRPEEFGHGRTRNLAVSMTQGEIVSLLTQDAIPADKSLLRFLSRAFEQKDVAGVAARQIPRPSASILSARDVNRWILGSEERRIVRISNHNEFEKLSPMQKYLMSVFDNVCSAFRRSVWEKIPFPDVPFGEDLEWGYRVLCSGYALAYEPQAIVYHSHDRSLSYQFRRMIMDHYRLCELFRLQTVPSALHIPGSVFRQTLADLSYLSHANAPLTTRLREMLNAPARSVTHVLGQYLGAHAYKAGRPPERIPAV